HLDRGDPRAGAQQRAREPAGAGPDLEHRPAGEIARNGRDAGQQLLVEQEVLPERLRRAEPVRGDHFAQRRKRHAAARRAAISPAVRIAAIVALALALPEPAMPKAVPWSGEVRTTGSPSVMLTPWSKSSAFSGTSAWSWYIAMATS